MPTSVDIKHTIYRQAGADLAEALRSQVAAQLGAWKGLPATCRRARRSAPANRYCAAFGLWYVGQIAYGSLYVDCDNGTIVGVRGRPVYIDWSSSGRRGLEIRPARDEEILKCIDSLSRFDANEAFTLVESAQPVGRR